MLAVSDRAGLCCFSLIYSPTLLYTLTPYRLHWLSVSEYTLHFHPFVIWLVPFPVLVPPFIMYSESKSLLLLLGLCWKLPVKPSLISEAKLTVLFFTFPHALTSYMTPCLYDGGSLRSFCFTWLCTPWGQATLSCLLSHPCGVSPFEDYRFCYFHQEESRNPEGNTLRPTFHS